MKKIGITGGIGSGKSIISHILRIMGYSVYDSDSWAKKLMNSNPKIQTALTAKFGQETYIDNKLNRQFLAKQIFNNKENLNFVNSIVHPIVQKHFLEWAQNQKSNLVFIESAILFSSGFNKILDKIIFTDAPQKIRIQRTQKRDNTSTEAIIDRINNQTNDETQAKLHADFIIINDNKTIIISQIISLLDTLKKD